MIGNHLGISQSWTNRLDKPTEREIEPSSFPECILCKIWTILNFNYVLILFMEIMFHSIYICIYIYKSQLHTCLMRFPSPLTLAPTLRYHTDGFGRYF